MMGEPTDHPTQGSSSMFKRLLVLALVAAGVAVAVKAVKSR